MFYDKKTGDPVEEVKELKDLKEDKLIPLNKME